MLQNAIIIAFIVQFLHACTWEGMIFNSLTERLWTLPNWIKMPLYGCPICMTPWWGAFMLMAVVVATGYPMAMHDVIEGVFTLFAAAGINAVFVQLYPHHEAE